MAEKYRYTFNSLGFYDCTVRFDFTGYVGASTTLVATDRPFVLKEYNTDEDIFKPVRPQMAEMSFIASATGVSIDDFLADNDNDITVYFDFGAYTNFWVGYLSQDDFQEAWIDTDHIITLRATDGIGYLKDIELTNAGNELNGRYNFIELLKFAMSGTSQNFDDYKVFSNLFHSSMLDTSTKTGLDQAFADAKTFMINPSEYDDSYTALEKINKSWNQTIFMYDGNWIIFRPEELYIPIGNNLRGYRDLGGTRTAINARYDALVGVNEDIKPVSPEMLRFINRRTKKDTIEFKYDQFDEIVCNGSFSRGDIVTDTITLKTYELDQWNWFQGGINSSTVPTTGSFGRKEEYTVLARLEDQYAFLTQDSSTTRFLKSCAIEVLKNEKIDISIDTKYKTTFAGAATLDTVVVMLYGVTNNYTLDDDGKWYQSNATWSTNLKTLQIYYNGSDLVLPEEWNNISVTSDPLPEEGNLYISLYNPNTPFVSSQERHFKSLDVKLISTFNGIDVNTIDAVQSIFTKTDNLRKSFFDEIYFDDGLSKLYKGSIYEDDEQTLTDTTWHRYRYQDEDFGFRKQNDITHWEHNRYNRNKLDVTFYGLVSDVGPIGLLNTIKFVDDDPNKIYWIANLKEIDYNTGIWSATLVEVWDENKDDTAVILNDFQADPNDGNYIMSGEFVIPYTILTAAEFSYDNMTKKFTYNGIDSITNFVTCNLNGDINLVNPSSTIVTFKLYINDIVVSTITHDATTTPSIFLVSLDGTYTINPGDNLYLTISDNVSEFDVNGGDLRIVYNSTGGASIIYDPYQDKYIYK